MYFVIYALEDEQYYIIPKTWIQDLKFERIVNYTLNSSIIYRCYSGVEPNAYIEDVPNVEFVPDFGVVDERNIFDATLGRFYGKWDIVLVCTDFFNLLEQ